MLMFEYAVHSATSRISIRLEACENIISTEIHPRKKELEQNQHRRSLFTYGITLKLVEPMSKTEELNIKSAGF